MLDINFIRDNADLVKDAARKKHIDIDIDALLKLDDKRKLTQQRIDDLRAKQNEASKIIARATSDVERQDRILEMKTVKVLLQKEEVSLHTVMQKWQQLLVQVPNIPDMTVPEGESDADNVEVRTWGEKPQFSFTPKSHIALMELHNMLDLERGAKVAGFRGYFLKNAGAALSMALWHFVCDTFAKEKPEYSLTMAPSLVRREPFIGTGYLPQSEEDLYKTQDGEYLAGTSEVAMMGMYMDETFDAKQLPMKFLAFSPCFRREAGSHGKDTKGIIRVHEFFKLEQIILCEANHETSVMHHEELTANSELLMQKLGIPYHVVVNCGGDIGLGQVKKYDIEAWVPSENTYRETHSSSYFHDFQTRRLNIRYRDEQGTLRFVHSLNNTAAATPRLLVSVLENNQQEDGSIRVPDVLRPYLNKEVLVPSHGGSPA